MRARAEPPWPPLLDAEASQLARGDIPYFFRLYGRPGIHYYGDRSALSRLRGGSQLHGGDVPQLDPVLQLSRGLRSPSRKKLREEGLFTLLGAFDHASLAGKHADDGLEVTFAARTLVVKLPDGAASCSSAAKPERLRRQRLPPVPVRRGAIGLRPARHGVRRPRSALARDRGCKHGRRRPSLAPAP